ncbi:MAG: MFS transporter [Rhodospirillaceae bacterium]|nr:MFS transporter [Rhodospirillaceae bacterium]
MEASSVVAGEPARDAVYAKILRRLIPFLLMCYIIAYLDRINVGFAKLQMLGDLQFTETVYGLGAGIFFIGYVVFEIPSNIVLMRVGARLWIGIIMIVWGVISAAMIYVASAPTFYVLRFLLGVAEAGFIPAVLYYLTLWFPSTHRGKASAMFLAGIPLSGIIGGPVSGWIMNSFNGAMGMAGWKWVFFLEALPAIVLGGICFTYLDNDVTSAKWLNSAEKDQVKRDLLAEAGGKALHSVRDGLLNGRVWLLASTYFFFTMGLYGISFWLPSIIQASGVADPLDVGMLTALPYIAALIAMIVVGRSSDKHKERRWHLALSAVTGAIGLTVSVMFADNTAISLAALTLAAMGIIPCVPQFHTLMPSITSGAAAAMGFAVANSVGSIAGFISPYLLGWVKDTTGSTSIGVMVLAAALVTGALMVFANPAKLLNR